MIEPDLDAINQSCLTCCDSVGELLDYARHLRGTNERHLDHIQDLENRYNALAEAAGKLEDKYEALCGDYMDLQDQLP